MLVADHVDIDELHAVADRQTDNRRFLRLRTIILARRGHAVPEIAHALGVSHRAVQDWGAPVRFSLSIATRHLTARTIVRVLNWSGS